MQARLMTSPGCFVIDLHLCADASTGARRPGVWFCGFGRWVRAFGRLEGFVLETIFIRTPPLYLWGVVQDVAKVGSAGARLPTV
jgi:hypothetical protein